MTEPLVACVDTRRLLYWQLMVKLAPHMPRSGLFSPDEHRAAGQALSHA